MEQPAQQAPGKAGSRSSSVTSVLPQLHHSSLDLTLMSSDCADQLNSSSAAAHEDELRFEAGEDQTDAAEEEDTGELLEQDPEADGQNPSHMPSRLQQPKIKLHIDGTYIVNNFTWLISSSVAPEQLQVYANSTAAAQFTVTALRVPVRPSAPHKYFVEGTITVSNPSTGQIDVAGINAVLPWGEAAMCKPTGDLVYPAKLDASAKLTCTFRLEYKLGLKPSSLRAHLSFVGSPNALKSWPKPFNFDRPDWSWSPGACARVSTSFTADSPDVSVTHAGGEAPAFGEPGTEVCQDFAKWDFTVLVTPVGEADGIATVSVSAQRPLCKQMAIAVVVGLVLARTVVSSLWKLQHNRSRCHTCVPKVLQLLAALIVICQARVQPSWLAPCVDAPVLLM